MYLAQRSSKEMELYCEEGRYDYYLWCRLKISLVSSVLEPFLVLCILGVVAKRQSMYCRAASDLSSIRLLVCGAMPYVCMYVGKLCNHLQTVVGRGGARTSRAGRTDGHYKHGTRQLVRVKLGSVIWLSSSHDLDLLIDSLSSMGRP